MAGSTFVAYHICVSIFLALFPKMAPIPKKTMEIAIGITPIFWEDEVLIDWIGARSVRV